MIEEKLLQKEYTLSGLKYMCTTTKLLIQKHRKTIRKTSHAEQDTEHLQM